MSKAFCCTFTTPEGTQHFEADTWGCLVGMLSSLIAVAEIAEIPGDLNGAAKAVLVMYRQYFWYASNRQRSQIAKAGMELDLIKCYLRDLTVAQTVRWFEENTGFKTSESAVERYWLRFRSLKGVKKGSFAAAGKAK